MANWKRWKPKEAELATELGLKAPTEEVMADGAE